MVGFPTENDDDMEAFCGLIENLVKIGRKYLRGSDFGEHGNPDSEILYRLAVGAVYGKGTGAFAHPVCPSQVLQKSECENQLGGLGHVSTGSLLQPGRSFARSDDL